MSVDGERRQVAAGLAAAVRIQDGERIAASARSRPEVQSVVVLTTALLGFFMLSLDSTAVNVALPGIEHTLGGTTAGLQWVIDAYTLMFAALLISAGAVSDRVGAKRLYGIGLAAFLASSAACGVAPTLGFLIGSRAIQGSAAAVILPASLALVRQAFGNPVQRAKASRQVGGTLAVAVFGALISARASFLPGLRTSVLIALVVLAGAAAAAFTLPPPRRENELTGLRP